MRKVILYIAMSLDGYIADSNKSVDWIEGDGSSKMIDTYSSFIKNIDTVIMGKRTYSQIVNELSPNQWPYANLTTYVFTHDKPTNTTNIQFVTMKPSDLIETLRHQDGKDIWICGGAEIARQLLQENRIDIFHIALIPILLGNGIRLFESNFKPINLTLDQTVRYNGIEELIYTLRK